MIENPMVEPIYSIKWPDNTPSYDTNDTPMKPDFNTLIYTFAQVVERLKEYGAIDIALNHNYKPQIQFAKHEFLQLFPEYQEYDHNRFTVGYRKELFGVDCVAVKFKQVQDL